jgi:Raf kinase inhibitor-like YbhB/YbcL family protein
LATTSDTPRIPYDFLPPVPSFTVTSDQLAHGETLPVASRHSAMGVGGENLSPHLAWSGFPAETKSFAVTCFDPDAPTGSGFWHWLVIDIPASVTSLTPGAGASDESLPEGARHTRTDFGSFDYGGAAPPPGAPHRYVFAVHALDIDKLGVPQEASPAFVGFNLTSHTIARAVVVPVFGR